MGRMGEIKMISKEMQKNMQKQRERYKGLNGNPKTLDENFKNLLQNPSVPHLREGQVGEYEVKIDIIPAMKEMTVVSTRNWLLMGYKQLKVTFRNPRPLYKLLKKGGLMMSDSPQEMFLQYEAYKDATGKVLVGGLGLGMYASMIADKSNVTEVIIVEIDKDVIKLCKPKNKKIRIINDDVKKFLKETDEKFDYIYIDIHYSTGAMEYISTILPMRKTLSKRFPETPSSFWGESEMESQYDPTR